MPRGAPDYRVYQQKETLLGLYDRRGDVADYDNFEEPVLKWTPLAGVGGGNAILSTENCQSGSQSVRLIVPNAANASIDLRRGTGILGTKRLGLEISFSEVSDDLYLNFQLYCSYGGQLPLGAIRIDCLNGTAEYLNSGIAWVPFANIGVLRSERFSFHTLKFVVDIPGDRYIRAILNDIEYDLSAVTPLPRIAFIPNFIYYVLRAEPKVATGGDAWLDDFIFTLNEP